jgi:hypothetical protein
VKTRLPGQESDISLELEKMARQAEDECNRKIELSGSSMTSFLGRVEWRENDILIEIESGLAGNIAEYIAAHELGHVLQFARGCAIAGGREDEPEAVQIATSITDFVFDPMADTIASEYGISMASGFKAWIESTHIIDALEHPKRGRIYGNDWYRAWEVMTEARVRKRLGLTPPKLPRDFWTIYVALDFAKLSIRATNLGLGIGKDILERVKRVRLLSAIIDDLVDIGSASSVNQSVAKLQSVLDYFKAEPGHIYIHRPLTNEVFIEGKWQQEIPKTFSINDLLNKLGGFSTS